MRRRRIALRVVIVAATVAACFGHALHLASTEQKQVVLPGLVQFNTVTIGSNATRMITISPASGEQSDTINSIVPQGCSGFTVSAPGLPRTVSSVCVSGSGTDADACDSFSVTPYTFSATFTPTLAVTVSCPVLVTLNGGAQTHTITLQGTGLPPPIDIAIELGTPPSRCSGAGCAINFGPVGVGKNATPQPVVVRNAGSGSAMVTSIAISNPVFKFTTGNGNAVTLGPNGAVALALGCTPAATGPVTGTLTVNSNDPAGAKTLALSCEGIQSELDVTLTSLSVTTRVGDMAMFPGAPQLVLSNTGTDTMVINSITVTGDDLSIVSAPAPASTIAPGGTSAPISLLFAPKKVAAGQLGTLTVVFDSGMRPIPINGAALETNMSVTGIADLGGVCAGSTKKESFMVLASAAGGFDLRGITVPTPFRIVPTSPARVPTAADPIVLQGGALNSATFDLVVDLMGVTPPSPQLGGDLVLTTDIPGNPTRTIAVTAQMLAGGASATVPDSTDGKVDFGSLDVSNLSDPHKVFITNCTGAALAVEGTIVGDTDFKISASPDKPVPVTESDFFSLSFLPSSPGPKAGTLRIAHKDGAVEVPLVGNGNGGDPELPDPRDTYYNCSAGGAGAWGLAFAVLALAFVRRRRR